MRISVRKGNISKFQPEKNETIALKTDLLQNRNKIGQNQEGQTHKFALNHNHPVIYLWQTNLKGEGYFVQGYYAMQFWLIPYAPYTNILKESAVCDFRIDLPPRWNQQVHPEHVPNHYRVTQPKMLWLCPTAMRNSSIKTVKIIYKVIKNQFSNSVTKKNTWKWL
jgi:hypothetical protein